MIYLLLFFLIIFLFYDKQCNYSYFEHFTSKKIKIKDLLNDKNKQQYKILNDTITTYTRAYVTKEIYNVFKDLKIEIIEIEVNNDSLKLSDKSNEGIIYYNYSFIGNPKNSIYNGNLSIPFKGNLDKFDLIINKTKIISINDKAKTDFINNPDNKKLIDRKNKKS
jgi:hypothetical protein